MLWAIPSVFALQQRIKSERQRNTVSITAIHKKDFYIVRYQGIKPLLRRLIALGIHLFPSRTEKLSPTAPMVLQTFVGEQVIATFYEKTSSKRTRLFAYTGINALLSWWCRLFATRTGMNSVHAACDLMLPAPTNFTSFRLWESRSSPLFSREFQEIGTLFFLL